MNIFRRPLFIITRKITEQIGQDINRRHVNINNIKEQPKYIRFFVKHYNGGCKYFQPYPNRMTL